jgi:hypothetical protein
MCGRTDEEQQRCEVRGLRNELEFIAERLPPDRHVAAFEKLRKTHLHSIHFFADGMTGQHGYNCFMYALGVREFPVSPVDVCRRVEGERRRLRECGGVEPAIERLRGCCELRIADEIRIRAQSGGDAVEGRGVRTRVMLTARRP